ncbi:hypothetical protein B296_00032676 [Ensete ventricosum]|uniref:Uncharacterized protein n=1 Tax=Ensete ventricosum TaxID=4639 RepID=A0A426ZXV3_ENSVE|nr:hypothetical protein B296_00032676 [Ensete ventricosum]
MDADMDVGVRLRGCVLNPNPRLPTRIVVVLYRREANLDAPSSRGPPVPITRILFPSAVVHSPWSYGVGAASGPRCVPQECLGVGYRGTF